MSNTRSKTYLLRIKSRHKCNAAVASSSSLTAPATYPSFLHPLAQNYNPPHEASRPGPSQAWDCIMKKNAGRVGGVARGCGEDFEV